MKYKIDPIPGMPEWFTPGIVCRVRDQHAKEWQRPRPIDGFMSGQFPFRDRDGMQYAYAEPVEQWEPKECEWVAAWNENATHFRVVMYHKDGPVSHYARLSYPDGRVIDCACSVEELKNRTEWV